MGNHEGSLHKGIKSLRKSNKAFNHKKGNSEITQYP